MYVGDRSSFSEIISSCYFVEIGFVQHGNFIRGKCIHKSFSVISLIIFSSLVGGQKVGVGGI